MSLKAPTPPERGTGKVSRAVLHALGEGTEELVGDGVDVAREDSLCVDVERHAVG